jgi:hypothetical protein
MATVTVLTKAYDNLQLGCVDKFLKSRFKGLRITANVVGTTSGGWVQLAISGDDEKVALHYLDDQVGVCPASLEHVERFSVTRGYLTLESQSKYDLYVDIGVFSPDIVHARIPLQRLQAQIVDGRKMALGKVCELFGFCEGLSLSIKIININGDERRVEAELSEKQLIQYRSWLNSLLDRLIIIGSTQREIEWAIRKTGLGRDVLGVQPFAFFEHSVACKLGTDAAGLIPNIGKILRNATFTIFDPRKIVEFLETPALTFQ